MIAHSLRDTTLELLTIDKTLWVKKTLKLINLTEYSNYSLPTFSPGKTDYKFMEFILANKPFLQHNCVFFNTGHVAHRI